VVLLFWLLESVTVLKVTILTLQRELCIVQKTSELCIYTCVIQLSVKLCIHNMKPLGEKNSFIPSKNTLNFTANIM